MISKKYLKSKAVCKVTFSLSTEYANAKEVRILGTFNNWSWEDGVVMKVKDSAFEASVDLATGQTYEFRYRTLDGRWLNDDGADNYVPSPYYGIDNSVVTIEEVKATPAPAPKPKKAAKPKAKAKPVAKTKPVVKASETDDLKKIEGIGPKIEKLLQVAGIQNFKDLSKAKQTVLKNVLTEAGSRYKMHDPTTWPEQAKLAAKGQWDALAKLQEELKGGKR